MSTQTFTESFRKLSTEEKIRVIQELWDEIAEDSTRIPLSESHRRLLDERLREHDENPNDVETWETARDDILGEL